MPPEGRLFDTVNIGRWVSGFPMQTGGVTFPPVPAWTVRVVLMRADGGQYGNDDK